METWILALMDGNNCKGFYKADDEALTQHPVDAVPYDDQESATRDCAMVNDLWNLQGQETFAPVQRA